MDYKGVIPKDIIEDHPERHERIPQFGSMYMFGYMPLHKDKLPYYDIFPLVVPIDTHIRSSEYFIGLNFHYLPHKERLILFDNMLKFTNQKEGEDEQFIIDYNMLTKYSILRYYKPAIKKYLYRQMATKFTYIHPSEWSLALFLPTETFKKSNRKEIWDDSREKI
jgi:hypothetical protein